MVMVIIIGREGKRRGKKEMSKTVFFIVLVHPIHGRRATHVRRLLSEIAVNGETDD